jgi:hypothetical protein
MSDKKPTVQPPKPPVVKAPTPVKPTSMPGGTAPKMRIQDSVDRKKQKN